MAYTKEASITTTLAVDGAGIAEGFTFLTLSDSASGGKRKKDGEDEEDWFNGEVHRQLWGSGGVMDRMRFMR